MQYFMYGMLLLLFPVFVHNFSPFSGDLFSETRKIRLAGQQVILFYEQSSC